MYDSGVFINSIGQVLSHAGALEGFDFLISVLLILASIYLFKVTLSLFRKVSDIENEIKDKATFSFIEKRVTVVKDNLSAQVYEIQKDMQLFVTRKDLGHFENGMDAKLVKQSDMLLTEIRGIRSQLQEFNTLLVSISRK